VASVDEILVAEEADNDSTCFGLALCGTAGLRTTRFGGDHRCKRTAATGGLMRRPSMVLGGEERQRMVMAAAW
jgi:hypothetical protein